MEKSLQYKKTYLSYSVSAKTILVYQKIDQTLEE